MELLTAPNYQTCGTCKSFCDLLIDNPEPDGQYRVYWTCRDDESHETSREDSCPAEGFTSLDAAIDHAKWVSKELDLVDALR